MTNLKVVLETTNTGGLSVFADANGSFTFKNLTGGTYTIVINAGDEYEVVREPVYIDESGTRNVRGGLPRTFTVPIYLVPKHSSKSGAKPGVINAALTNVPAPAQDFYQKALESERAGDIKSAVEQLKAAVSYYPEFPLALNELGVQYLKQGQANQAVHVLSSAVKLAPDAFIPRLNYGIALLEINEFGQAEKQLREALKRNEASPTAHMYLGVALLSLSKDRKTRQFDLAKYTEAQREFELAVRSGKDEVAMAHRYLGGIYWGNREYGRAANEFEIYLKLAPKAPDAQKLRDIISDLRSKG